MTALRIVPKIAFHVVSTRSSPRRFTALAYPHKPGMAVWLNDWSTDFAPQYTRLRANGHVLSRTRCRHLVIAHMGMPEYAEFMAIAEQFDNVMPGHEDGVHSIHRRVDAPNIPCACADALRFLTEIPGVDDDWLRNVLHHNAARLFELQTA